jgi:hypothetical protein
MWGENMDSGTFDRWTRRVAKPPRSRRGLLRLGVGGSLGLLGVGTVADDALACVKTGTDCKRGKPHGNCCSGTCKRGRCRRTPDAKGCQVTSGDICRNQGESCPNNLAGLCVKLDTGKPFCAEAGGCQVCTSSADCTTLPNGRCVTNCPRCQGTSNQGCFYSLD